MQTSLADTIRARIAELVAEREKHAQEAKRIDFGYATVIGELERLLALVETQQEGNANATTS